jgi:hypothetical protein
LTALGQPVLDLSRTTATKSEGPYPSDVPFSFTLQTFDSEGNPWTSGGGIDLWLPATFSTTGFIYYDDTIPSPIAIGYWLTDIGDGTYYFEYTPWHGMPIHTYTFNVTGPQGFILDVAFDVIACDYSRMTVQVGGCYLSERTVTMSLFDYDGEPFVSPVQGFSIKLCDHTNCNIAHPTATITVTYAANTNTYVGTWHPELAGQWYWYLSIQYEYDYTIGYATADIIYTSLPIYGAIDAAETLASGTGIEDGTIDEDKYITIYARDAFGQPTIVCDAGTFDVYVEQPNHVVVSGSAVSNEDGTYVYTYNPPHTGNHEIVIKQNGIEIQGSPFTPTFSHN